MIIICMLYTANSYLMLEDYENAIKYYNYVNDEIGNNADVFMAWHMLMKICKIMMKQ